jgi:hypothetical protein
MPVLELAEDEVSIGNLRSEAIILGRAYSKTLLLNIVKIIK